MTTPKKNKSDDLEKERSLIYKAIEDSLISDEQSSEIAEENEREINWDAENAQLDFHNRIERKIRRERWDTTLLVLVVFGFGASYWLIILIGTGILKFEDNAFAVPSVVAVGIVQTYGLSKLAIRYFFSDDNVSNGMKRK